MDLLTVPAAEVIAPANWRGAIGISGRTGHLEHARRRALDGGPDGLALIRRLLAQAATRLAPGGLMLLEIETGQGALASALARQCFPNAYHQVKPDLARHDRLLSIQTPL